MNKLSEKTTKSQMFFHFFVNNFDQIESKL